MEDKSDNRHDEELAVQPSTLLFAGRLTKARLKSLPDHFFLLSNVADPFNSAMELEVHRETCREELWRSITDHNLNGRSFSAFRSQESMEAEKLSRWRGALRQFGVSRLMQMLVDPKLAQTIGTDCRIRPSTITRSRQLVKSSQ